ncbi:hypothetical protein LXA47_03155 [Massilia sp. P8910]|nr:hypothetical protein [Massilia antarctica]
MVQTRQKGWYGPYKFSNLNTATDEYKKSWCGQASADTFARVGVYLGEKRRHRFA